MWNIRETNGIQYFEFQKQNPGSSFLLIGQTIRTDAVYVMPEEELKNKKMQNDTHTPPDSDRTPESGRRHAAPTPQEIKEWRETRLLTDELRQKLLRAGMPQTALRKNAAVSVLADDGHTFIDLKITDINTESGEVMVRDKDGNEYVYASMESLSEQVEDAKYAAINMNLTAEKLRNVPEQFDLYVQNRLFTGLRIKNIDYRSGEVIVSSADGRL